MPPYCCATVASDRMISRKKGSGAGLAYQILQSGLQLNVPRLFAALFLISLAGVALFLLMVGLTRLALGHWHESELLPDR